jgi:oligopeptide transport system permease protein
MAVAEQNQQARATTVARIGKPVRGEGYWADAWRRLRRNRAAIIGVVIILANLFMALFASVLAPKTYDRQVLVDKSAAPQWVIDLFPVMIAQGEPGGYVKVSDEYTLGADTLGRDLLSRIIYGSRVSLAVAFIGPLFSILAGLVVGLVAGYAGGRVDNILMRFTDLMYAFPTLLFIILLMTFFRQSFASPAPGTLAHTLGRADQATGGMLLIFIGIGLTSWMQMARLVRGQVLSVREKEYIEAAHAIGTTTPTIMFRHIMPNILGPLVVAETLTIPTYISYEAFLSFIGLGVNPPTPSWGSMIAEGARSIGSYPNQALFPAVALFLIMFSFNFLGDGLRDALDPRMRGAD